MREERERCRRGRGGMECEEESDKCEIGGRDVKEKKE